MAKQRQRLVEVPFSKTDCGVDFYINTAYGGECPWVLRLKEYPVRRKSRNSVSEWDDKKYKKLLDICKC